MPIITPRIKAVLLCTLAYVLFTINDSLRKYLVGEGYDIFSILLWSEFSGLVVACTLAKYLGGFKRTLQTQKRIIHLFRALSVIITISLAIYAFGNLPMVDTYTIIFTSPLIIAIVSKAVFKEALPLNSILVILTGFVGVIVAFNPAFEAITLAHFAALGVAVFHSANLLFSKALGNTETKLSFILFQSSMAVIASLILLKLSPTIPQMAHLHFFILGGISQVIGTISVSLAFANAPGAILAPIHYSQLVWGALIGFTVFGDIPNSNIILGAAIIVLAGLYLIRHTKNPR